MFQRVLLVATVLFAQALSSKNSTNWQQRNYNTIKAIYNTTIFPNNQAFIHEGPSAVPAGLFGENATGRITPVGNFSGFEDSVEYFFGLTPVPQAPHYATWTSAKIVSFSSGCPEVASSLVYGRTTGVNPNISTYGQTVSTIKQMVFWRFDKSGAVTDYEAWLPTLQPYIDIVRGGPQNSSSQAATIGQLCTAAQQLCTGANQQYDSTECCVASLSRKPFGSWDEIWGDNTVCRSLHVLLAKLRPAEHCPHVGPTGGGKCVDMNYNHVYFDDLALFGAPSGHTFMCPGIQA